MSLLSNVISRDNFANGDYYCLLATPKLKCPLKLHVIECAILNIYSKVDFISLYADCRTID